MLKPARFWNRMAAGYARSPISDMESYETKLARTRALFRPDMRLLEVGCGTGSTALLHAPHVAHITATDISSEMLAIARAKAAEQGVDNISFEEAALDAIEIPPTGYDMVLAMSVIHLLPDRDAGLNRLFRLVKPGGYLVTSTVCIAETAPLIGIVMRLGRPLGLILRSFTRAQLEDSIRAAGFDIEDSWRPGEDRKKAVFHISRRP